MRIFLGLLIFLGCKSVFGQTYRVTAVDGRVFYRHQPVKVQDTLNNFDSLYASSQQARMGLINPKLGMKILSFKGGVLVAQKENTGMERYRILVKDWAKGFFQTDLLGTKSVSPEAGPVEYFATYNKYEDSTNASNKRFLLTELDYFVARPASYKLDSSAYFVLRVGVGVDGRNVRLPANRDTVFFYAPELKSLVIDKAFDVNLLYHYVEGGKAAYEKVAAFRAVYLSADEAGRVVESLMPALKELYGKDKGRVFRKLKEHFDYYYGVTEASAIYRLYLQYQE